MKRLAGLVLIMVILLFTTNLSAVGAISGNEILTELDNTMKAESKYMQQEMLLYSTSGSERSRTLEAWNKAKDGTDQMLARFTGPANIAGTSFLMVDDDMWLYMPALGKVKRIAGSAKQGSFMGSDLTYEDMQALGNTGFKNNYRAEFIGEEEIDNKSSYHLELVPASAEISYKKIEIWVDCSNWLPLKIDYYNSSGELEKVLTTSGHKEIDGQWTAGRMEIENKSKGTKTVLVIKELNFAEEIPEQIFTTRYLERGQ